MGTFAAAILALLMLSYASVQSGVMQAAMAAGVVQPMCGGPLDPAIAAMAQTIPSPKTRVSTAPRSSDAPAKSCPYCAAAAHAPIMGAVAPWRASSAVTFAVFLVAAGHGPRGPPACQPRARGPPSNPLSL